MFRGSYTAFRTVLTITNRLLIADFLLLFYSGINTKAVAEFISASTEGELHEIVPETPYNSDDLNWTVATSRSNKEHDFICLCSASEPAYTSTPPQSSSAPMQEQPSVQTDWITEQILSGEDGEIYFTDCLPGAVD